MTCLGSPYPRQQCAGRIIAQQPRYPRERKRRTIRIESNRRMERLPCGQGHGSIFATKHKLINSSNTHNTQSRIQTHQESDLLHCEGRYNYHWYTSTNYSFIQCASQSWNWFEETGSHQSEFSCRREEIPCVYNYWKKVIHFKTFSSHSTHKVLKEEGVWTKSWASHVYSASNSAGFMKIVRQ